MPTNSERSRFIADVFEMELLDRVIDWIAENKDPEDVFPEKRLQQWASENGFTSEE